jgi:dihydroorotase-like cyclic amidohydrolase
MKRMIDCHCHFYPPQFGAQDLPELEAAAAAVGVTAIVTVPERYDVCCSGSAHGAATQSGWNQQ